MSHPSTASATNGYTLIELLVVLAILGLLTAVGIPLLSSSRPALEARAVATILADDLRNAHQRAIDEATVQRFVFHPSAGRYTNADGKQRLVPKGIAIALRSQTPNEIDFYPDGSSNGGTFVVSTTSVRHRVTVRWPTGQIAVDD